MVLVISTLEMVTLKAHPLEGGGTLLLELP